MSVSVSSSNRFPEIDKYELLEEIGHGGMATVYRARDLRLEREVAIKVIHKHLRANTEVRHRFVAEARAVAKLRHPGIVEVFDVSPEEDDELYLVVELIRGMSLRELLQEYQVLPPEIGAILVIMLCGAVEHAHQTGVIHRDIKPENVLLELGVAGTAALRSSSAKETPAGEPAGDASSSPGPSNGERPRRAQGSRVNVKLTDFGIAKVLDAQGLTSTGQILGSPAHMAPEQIEGGKIGPHTDVFALGVLLYEAVVGHLPFEGQNPAQVLRRVLDGSFEAADRERAVVGGRFAGIIAAALTRDLDSRLGSAAEMAELLDDELVALGFEDQRAELDAYFDDPRAWREATRDALVPRLLARGERERRAGRVHGAAADFNRALALRPDDLAILKRVSSLSSRAAWRQRSSRLAMIAAGSCALFGAAYGVSRWFKPSAVLDDGLGQGPSARIDISALAPLPTDAPSGATSSPAPSASALPSGQASGVPLSTGSARLTMTSTVSASDGGTAPGTRKVAFVVSPGGAKLVVDGTPRKWFGPVHELSLGPHGYTASVAGGCCEDKSGSFVVKAAAEGQEDVAQLVSIRVPIKPAVFVLKGGPGGSAVSCKGATATPGSPAHMDMTKTTWSGICRFSNGAGRRLTLAAGKTRTITWPQ